MKRWMRSVNILTIKCFITSLSGSDMGAPGHQIVQISMQLFITGLSERYNIQIQYTKTKPHTIEDLKREISTAAMTVSAETAAAVVRNFRRRLQILHLL
jgi:hypothetical protein